MRAQRTFAAAALLAAASLLSAQAWAAGVAGFHPACGTCHKAEPPAAANADPIACHGCHGETPEKGSVVVNGKTLNPHAGHFDVYECTQCHKPHQASVNGCAECHKEVKEPMPEK